MYSNKTARHHDTQRQTKPASADVTTQNFQVKYIYKYRENILNNIHPKPSK